MSVAVVTGAAGHIGSALVDALIEDGGFDAVVAADRADLANQRASNLRVDLSTPAGAQGLADHALTLGEVRLLVNAAGLCEPTPQSEPFAKAASDLSRIADNNLLALILPSRALVPHLINAGSALIVNVTSRDLLPAEGQLTQSPDHDLWLASQWAVNGATDAWALDLARHGVRVNGLCIGGIDGTTTPFPEPDWPHDQVSLSALAELLRELIDSDLTGENIGFWPGRTGPLRSARTRHRQITG